MTQKAPEFGEPLEAEAVAACFSLSTADLLAGYPPQVVSTGAPFLIVPALDIEVLKKAEMQRDALRALCTRTGASCAYMFCPGGFAPDVDLHGRFFGPDNANEDPYTGSAGGSAGAYVVHHGLLEGPELTLEQGNIIGRPGIGTLIIAGGPGNVTGVQLGGAAVKVLDGHFFMEESDG
jgi:trans-2,3-dihydro-3-hydroxyanthranilate isomerase